MCLFSPPPPPPVGGVDLNSSYSGCACLGSGVVPQLGVVEKEVAVLIALVRRHRSSPCRAPQRRPASRPCTITTHDSHNNTDNLNSVMEFDVRASYLLFLPARALEGTSPATRQRSEPSGTTTTAAWAGAPKTTTAA